MEGEHTTCPYCGTAVPIDDGTWPYRYTQLVQHLAECAGELPQPERQRLAAMAVDNVGQALSLSFGSQDEIGRTS